MPASELELGDDVEAQLKTRRVWPYLLVLSLLLLGGAGLGYYLSTRPDPKLILVAVDIDGYWWEGSEASAIVTDRFAARLEELGFTPVRSGDPKVTDLLERAESPETAQGQLGAGFLVSGRLEPEFIEHPVEGGYFEVRTKGNVVVRHIGEDPVQAGSVDGWSGAKNKKRAAALLGKNLADRVFDRAIAALMDHPVLKGILEGPDAIERGKLKRAKAYVDLRKTRLEAAGQAYRDMLKQRKAAEKGGHDLKYHGVFDAEDTLCGVTPRGFLSKQSRIRPFFSPRNNELNYYRELDHLRWVSFDGKPTDVVRGYNLYSYPATSPEGEVVLYIEDIFGWAKTITLVRGDSKPKRVRVDPKHRFQAPRVAPKGKLAAMYDKPCRKCPPHLLVVELTAGKTVFSIDAKDGDVQGYDWLSEHELLVAFKPFAPPPPPSEGDDSGLETVEPTEPPPGGLFVVDLAAKKPELERVYEAGEGESFSWVRSSRDGKKVVLPREAPDTERLALFDREAHELESYQVGGGAYMPEIAPDGSAAVFEQDGEIVHFEFAPKRRTRLTNNAVRDRYPAFSPDGKRIYYESLGDDPNFSRSRNVSIIASIAAP